ncbi:hypothetical protein ASG43_16885 [Aureimonas sp. Leaf454]|uniref:TVP38/TMEM64 family protein n=1 Tax=Aureimonas sp. Leaf454 TaxID=1736381 RepID=UPI0006F81E65|nr:TVP38/TMEM64 family protein [Aureimonas sp. Leaf454]KQT43174.1 hypothetical protein ASG43_16885 [Aureimonas sp. Leaf454]
MTPRGWILLLVLAALTIGAYALGVTDLLSIEAVKARRGELLALVASHPLSSGAVFLVVYAAVVALSLPAASVMTLLGGFLFGTLVGGILAVVAATSGAIVLFLVARSSLGGPLRQRAGPLAERVAGKFRDNAFEYLLFMRIVPLFPFFAVNIVPALLGVGLRTFALATLLGILPGTFIYAHLGRELGAIASLSDLVSANVLFALTLLGLVALLPAAYRLWKSRRSGPAALVAILCVAVPAAGGGAGAGRALAADLAQVMAKGGFAALGPSPDDR